jgi:microcystin-dependent protein
MQALPGVAPQSSSKQTGSNQTGAGGRLVPAAADPIPPAVLANPIVGEARRFDGSVAPQGWILAQGQTLSVTANRPLFSVLGTVAGGDGKSIFALPKPRFGMIVAVAGTLVTSPQALVRTGRHMTPKDSLGPNAIAAMPPMPKTESAQVIAERRLLTSSVRVGASRPVPMSPELVARARQATGDARAAAYQQLGPGNRVRLDSAVEQYLSGRIALYDAVTEMAGALTNGEADALFQVRDAMIRQVDGNGYGARPADLRGEASRYLLSVTITNEQIATATLRGIDLR